MPSRSPSYSPHREYKKKKRKHKSRSRSPIKQEKHKSKHRNRVESPPATQPSSSSSSHHHKKHSHHRHHHHKAASSPRTASPEPVRVKEESPDRGYHQAAARQGGDGGSNSRWQDSDGEGSRHSSHRVVKREPDHRGAHRDNDRLRDDRPRDGDRQRDGDRHRDNDRQRDGDTLRNDDRLRQRDTDRHERHHHDERRREKRRDRPRGQNPFTSSGNQEPQYEYGRPDQQDGDDGPPQEKEKPNFETSGKLTEDTNTFKGVVIKYNEPEDARKPKRRWRLYPFKGDEALPILHVHRQSAYLLGRDRRIADIPVDHPSCSKQHAVLQFRMVPFTREDGTEGRKVRPYIIDLGSANGTHINNKRIDGERYHELIEKDVLKFGFSSREYVVLTDKSDATEFSDSE